MRPRRGVDASVWPLRGREACGRGLYGFLDPRPHRRRSVVDGVGMSKRSRAEAHVHIDEPHVCVTEYKFAPGAETGWHRHGADYIMSSTLTLMILASSKSSISGTAATAAGRKCSTGSSQRGMRTTLLTDDCEFWSSSGPLAQGGVFEGKTAVAKATAAIFRTFPDAAWVDGRLTLFGRGLFGDGPSSARPPAR